MLSSSPCAGRSTGSATGSNGVPEELEDEALARGFLLVSSTPLTRSSYHADEDCKKLSIERQKRQNRPNP